MVEYFVHGVHLAVESGWSRFLTYTDLNLRAFSPRRPTEHELRVTVSLDRKPWLAGAREEIAGRPGEERWGDDLFSDGRGVRFRSGLLKVEFTTGPPAEVRASYLLDRRTRLAGFLGDVPRWEEVQRVARLALYLPLFHLFERTGWVVLHAGALAGTRGGVVLAGLNGSGKSTLCSSLIGPLSLMSDNYIVWTGTEILGFPEALRLPLERAPASAARYPTVWGKRLVPPDPSRLVLSARPRALVFLTLGDRTSIVPLGESEAWRRLDLVQDMTAEFPRYGYLGPVSPPRHGEGLRSLTRSVSSYALTVGDLAPAREKVVELAGTAP